MPAVSDKQRKFMGAVMALKKGTLKGKPSAKLKEAAGSMSEKQVGDFMHVKKSAAAQTRLSRLVARKSAGFSETVRGIGSDAARSLVQKGWNPVLALADFVRRQDARKAAEFAINRPLSEQMTLAGWDAMAGMAKHPIATPLALGEMVKRQDFRREADRAGVPFSDMLRLDDADAWLKRNPGRNMPVQIGESPEAQVASIDQAVAEHRRTSNREPASNRKANLITAGLLLGLLGIGAGSVWADRRRIAQIKRMQQLEPEAIAGVEESMRRLDEAEQRRGRNRYEDLKAAGQLDL